MKIYHVVAVANNRVIGKENKLPWHFSEDLKYFKALTTGGTVIMGRKTFDSIGRPLPNRENFVLSRTSKPPSSEHLLYFNCIENALSAVKTEKAFIIGGSTLYAQTLDKIDGIYLTRINASYEGDAFYPEIPVSFEQTTSKILQETPKIEALFLARKS